MLYEHFFFVLCRKAYIAIIAPIEPPIKARPKSVTIRMRGLLSMALC